RACPMVERRSVPRFRFHRHAIVALPGSARSVTILELSMRGALVQPVATGDMQGFAPGARCTLRFLTVDGHAVLAMPATVARCAEDGRAGLEIRDMGSVGRRMLRQLIEHSLGSETILQHDLPALFEAVEPRQQRLSLLPEREPVR